MPMNVPDGSRGCLVLFLSGAILQGGICFSAAEGSDAASDPAKLPDRRSRESSNMKFLGRRAKRVLREPGWSKPDMQEAIRETDIAFPSVR